MQICCMRAKMKPIIFSHAIKIRNKKPSLPYCCIPYLLKLQSFLQIAQWAHFQCSNILSINVHFNSLLWEVSRNSRVLVLIKDEGSVINAFYNSIILFKHFVLLSQMKYHTQVCACFQSVLSRSNLFLGISQLFLGNLPVLLVHIF